MRNQPVYSVDVTADPAIEPVSLTDVAHHVRNEVSNLEGEASTIAIQIQAARENLEGLTGRAFITQTQRLSLDRLPSEILVPNPPLQSVTTFAYTDTDGASQTLTENTDFIVNTLTQPGTIKPERTASWPALYSGVYNVVQITYVAGYGATAGSVPASLRQAILLMVGHWYKTREPIIYGTIATKIEKTVDHLIDSYRVQQFGRIVAA